MSRIELLGLDEEIRSCRRCRLWKAAKRAVPGEGDPASTVVFIGEAPGYWEDVEGRPFVGAAGKLLNEMLVKIGLSRSEVYITNVVKHRPPRNRDPRPDEVESCTPYLNRQLEIIEPRFIVTLGRHSTAYILSKMGHEIGGITSVRGRIFEGALFGRDIHVIPTFHPAAALYNVKYKDCLERDFQSLKNELEKDRERRNHSKT